MGPDDDWIGAIQGLGLASAFGDRIMDPEVEDMRLSGSLKRWVVMMVEARYEMLATLDEVVKAQYLKSQVR